MQWSTSLYKYRILCVGMQSKHRIKDIVKHCCLTLEEELLLSALDTAAWYRANFSFKETVSSKSINVFPALGVLSSGNPLTRLRWPTANTKRHHDSWVGNKHFFPQILKAEVETCSNNNLLVMVSYFQFRSYLGQTKWIQWSFWN